MTALRYALRSLARSPGFVAIAVVALGVGLGLSTMMFAVMDTLRHPYSAYRDPESLFTVHWYTGRNNPMRADELYRYFREHTRSFDTLPAGWGPGSNLTRDAAKPVEAYPMFVSPPWFALTGLRPAMGRAFTGSDGPDVMIVSRQIWRSLFGNQREIDGATVTFRERTMSVIGVMPEGVTNQAVWIPLPPGIDSSRPNFGITPYVRLRPGVTREQADAELAVVAEELTARYDSRRAPYSFNLGPVVRQKEELRDLHKAMIGAALAVLLIACVNLAHLMLTRGLAKRRELALRMALGAGRGTIVRQMFLECVIITLGGAVL